jgi:predicted transposase YdaD
MNAEKTVIEHKTGQRGTDEAFVKLMALSGDALLKLLGMDAQTAATYHFRATVLKEKRLSPDIEGWSLTSGDQPRVLLEFQGYEDPFIRYRLTAKVCMSCAQDSYNGSVLAGIIYTSEAHRKAALSLTPFEKRSGCRFDDCFVEVVLSDFSEKQLREIDPRLLILAPLTMKADIDPETLKSKGRAWQEEINDSFPEKSRHEAIEIMGLLAVAHFRSFNVKEIIHMLNLDPNPDGVFTRIYNDGRQEGEQKGEAKMLTRQLTQRFGDLSSGVREKISAAGLDELELWIDRVLDARSLEDVFGHTPVDLN